MGVEINYQTRVIKAAFNFQQKGDSAYKIAVDSGFVGTKEEWLASLKQPAIDAADVANQAALNADEVAQNADSAADNADEKATLAQQGADNANNKATIAQTAADNANNAANYATGIGNAVQQIGLDTIAVKNATDQVRIDTLAAKQAAETATTEADTAISNANDATDAANQAATNADAAADNANEATTNAELATTNANTAADNANGAFYLFKNYVNALFGITQPETVAIIDRAFDEGFALPLSNRLHAYDNLIYDLKQGLVWNIEDLILNFAYNQLGLEGFCRINHKNPTGNLITLVGGLIYTVNGFEGNGIDGYIDTNFNPSIDTNNYTLNNSGRGAILYKSTQSGAINRAGIDSAGGLNFNTMRNAVSYVQQLNSGNVSSPADLSGTGYKGISRTVSTGVSIVNKSVKTDFISASTGIRNDTQRLFMTEGLCSDIGISGYHLGAARTDAQNFAYRTAYNKFFQTIGLPQIA